MPKMSDTMTEGVIAEWHKKVGDTVKSGDVLAEVETDKATMDLEAYDEGTLLYIGVEKGQAVPIDGVLAIVGKAGEDFKGLLDGSGSSNGSSAPKAEVPAEKPVASADRPAPASNGAEQPAPKAPAPAAPAANINASIIRMPKMSDTMTEGTIVAWHKKEGDTVKSGDVLAEVETDKATMDLEAYEEGTLLYIGVKEGSAVAVDDVIAVVGEKGADFKALLQGGGQAAPAAETAAPAPEAQPASVAPAETASENGHDSRVFASPLAKSIAKEKGVNLAQVQGSGPDGRIVKRDVETFQPAAQPAPVRPGSSRKTGSTTNCPRCANRTGSTGRRIRGYSGKSDAENNRPPFVGKSVYCSAFLPDHGNQHGQGDGVAWQSQRSQFGKSIVQRFRIESRSTGTEETPGGELLVVR
jgi:pyruvate dehydrogenase E2 component (dihydrolipoamide acetyltransferase)